MIDFTPLFRLYARRRVKRLAQQDPVAAQEKELLKLVRRAAGTRFGKDHDFTSIKSVADFQARVPLRTYEQMWTEYWQPAFPNLEGVSWPGPVPYLTLSSGTTSGASKYLPLTKEMRRSNVRAALTTLSLHAAANPKSKFFAGTSLMLGGSSDLQEEAPGIYSGDLSGVIAKTMPAWAKPFAFPPDEIALMSDWDAKLHRIAEASLDRSVRVITGTPSWVLILLERVAQLRAQKGEAGKLYPELSLYVHGAVNFAPYRERFNRLFEGQGVDFREVYPASEGFVAIADRGPGEGLRLLCDNGIFFEFVPLDELGSANPTRHWVKTIQPEIDYAVVMSTNSGLFSYVIGDTVRFVTTNPPRLLITGRTSYMLSAFGEHLIAEEIESAVAKAAGERGLNVTDYSVGPIFPAPDSDVGGHLYVIEFETQPDAATVASFGEAVDTELKRMNDDYRAHRAGMFPPRFHAVPPGTFMDWMRARGRLGGQNKVPRIITKADLLQNLRDFTGAG